MRSITTILAGLVLAVAGSETLTAAPAEDAILERAAARVVNGGINPSYFGYEITGRVLVGGNSCVAAGHKVRLVQERQGDTIIVKAERLDLGLPPQICPRIWQPVYKNVRATVHGDRNQIHTVLVKNVDQLGVDLTVIDLLA